MEKDATPPETWLFALEDLSFHWKGLVLNNAATPGSLWVSLLPPEALKMPLLIFERSTGD